MLVNQLKTLLACLCIGMLLSACGGGNDQLKQLVKNHFNALNRHDAKLLVKDYNPNVEVTSSGWTGIHNGTREVMFDNAQNFHVSPDLRYDIEHVYFSGDSIITVQYTTSGTLTNPEASTPVKLLGKKYLLDKCTVFTLRDHKIVKEATYYDQFSFLNQMGFFDQPK